MQPLKKPVILFVDDNYANLNIAKNMLGHTYHVHTIQSAPGLYRWLENRIPHLILLDIDMPKESGLDVLRKLKASKRYSHIPIILVTSPDTALYETQGLALGAADYVPKPYVPAIMQNRIDKHLLLQQQANELYQMKKNMKAMMHENEKKVLSLHHSIINTMAEMVEFRDAITGGHLHRIQAYMELLINYLKKQGIYQEEQIMCENMDVVIPSTQLHDLGKIFISDTILNKPDKLTEEEYKIMQTHVLKGVEAIQRMAKDNNHTFLQCAEVVARTHHERWDGSGYPAGLKETEIPLLGRLMAIADVYDALTSTRPYKKPLAPEEAAKFIINNSDTHFDPTLVDIFKEISEDFATIALIQKE